MWSLCKDFQAQRTVSNSDGSLIGVDKSENTLVADLGGRGHANSTSNVVLAHFCPASKYEEDEVENELRSGARSPVQEVA